MGKNKIDEQLGTLSASTVPGGPQTLLEYVRRTGNTFEELPNIGDISYQHPKSIGSKLSY